jgi:outer membrane protein OmpA-like peptidoglycan-associated protein
MTQQSINVGAAANDGTGDPDRTAFQKTNANFNDLYQPQRRSTTATVTVAATDVVINCDTTSGPQTCALPDASTRGGKPLIFKDAAGKFATNNLTITPFSGQTMDGLATVVLNNNYQRLRLTPYTDGVGTGWSIG